ncbi:MAG TPA: DUF554 domain-containing protein [Candidatus Avacidaminococcus intestinavium]|uniref:DUF554 domain-containing protein n=1 Tax=Candidatus Avacidaminococcus intestinavium TaxID=2840684 RepID=A0A9D1MNX6_9FIRM|nr:DUF554 domain-containing protein [Candidatus Avacidaminococcus intestinavium]
MVGLGTIVNALAIIGGTCIGLVLQKGLPSKWQETIMQSIGLCICVIGLQMALKTTNIIIVIISIVLGVVIGEYLNIEHNLNRFGAWLEKKLLKKATTADSSGKFGEAFIAASLIYCVGAMAIVGSIQEGLTGDRSTLYAKSLLDGLTAIIFSANLGIGIALSAVSVLLYQGAITLTAGYLESIISVLLLTEITATGGIMIIAIGLNMLKLIEIRIANMLPAILVVGFVCKIISVLG